MGSLGPALFARRGVRWLQRNFQHRQAWGQPCYECICTPRTLARIAQTATVPIPTWLHRYAVGDTDVLDTLDHALRSFHATCLAPQWPTVAAGFHDDIAHRMSALGTHGLAAMINALSPDLCMTGSTLPVA